MTIVVVPIDDTSDEFKSISESDDFDISYNSQPVNDNNPYCVIFLTCIVGLLISIVIISWILFIIFGFI